MRVLVLKGGDSSEREVSLKSAKSVSAALKKAGHKVVEIDTLEGLDEIGFDEFEVVFPILHGDNGEDGVLQRQLESRGLSFLGSDSLSSEKAFNKETTHKILSDLDIMMPKHQIVSLEEFKKSQLSKRPFVLKTICGGSSVDIVLARSVDNKALKKGAEMLKKYDQMLLEELIPGQEITVGVLDGQPLPIIAINPPEGMEFDYENKYNGLTDEICPVPEELVSAKLQEKAQSIATKVHKALGVRHLSRTDMIVANDGKIFVLELNTMPGMTDQSLFPKAAEQAGYTMPELVQKFIDLVQSDNK